MTKVNLEIATLAGGCFWCTEAIFKRLKGVVSVMPGYSGGKPPEPGKKVTYDSIHYDNTGHAESIQIKFDSSIISYEKLLEVFFHLHDPTTENRQGNDVGEEYRSMIFYHDDKQKKLAEKVKKEIEDSKMYPNPVVTEILPFKNFYEAEENHKDFYAKNSYAPYCQYVIDPKIQKLMKEYRSDVKERYQQ